MVYNPLQYKTSHTEALTLNSYLRIFIALLLLVTASRIEAQKPQNDSAIMGYATPYRMEWNGKQGVFVRKALLKEPDIRQPLTFLHTDTGPKGSSKYLAWFLARDKGEFAILWCYLNDSGHDFWCWLYRFPSNQLTTVHFQGDYHFTPPAEPQPDSSVSNFRIGIAPLYEGPNFIYKDWSRRAGSLSKLTITPATPLNVKGSSTPETQEMTALNIIPLHDVTVPEKNGWRDSGWTELHTLAYDKERNPFYLILYSNATKGFVVDINRAHTYTADFGEKVVFGKSQQPEDPEVKTKENPPNTEVLTNTVKPYELYQIVLHNKTPHENPYQEVLLEADITTPDRKTWKVPGFWDGEGNWVVRFVPTKSGEWTYKTRSNDPELHNQFGGFTCANGESGREPLPLLQVRPNPTPHFALRDRVPLFPVALSFPTPDNPLSKTKKPEENFSLFQKQADALAELGANRLIGGFLLDTAMSTNEGGSLFIKNDPSIINPLFFQWLDRRVTYLNFKGIVPDIGIARNWDSATKPFTDSQLRWLWRYVVARYSAYGVIWNLTDNLNDGNQRDISAYAQLTRQVDSLKHILTARVSERAEGTPNIVLTQIEWLDYVTLQSTSLNALELLHNEERLQVIRDSSAAPDTIKARKRIWETYLRGGFWEFSPESNIELTEETRKAYLLCAKFFQQTRFSRLEPHPEMIGKPGETEQDRRNRRRSKQSIDAQPQLTEELKKLLKEQSQGSGVYTLCNPGREYVVYFTAGGSISLDLLEAVGTLKVRWYNPRTGEWKEDNAVMGGGYETFTAPDAQDWVLHIVRKERKPKTTEQRM